MPLCNSLADGGMKALRCFFSDTVICSVPCVACQREQDSIGTLASMSADSVCIPAVPQGADVGPGGLCVPSHARLGRHNRRVCGAFKWCRPIQPHPMHVFQEYDNSKQGGGAEWLGELLPHCMMLILKRYDPSEAQAFLGVLAALEKQIQGLFQEALDKKQVSTTANFFAEGGSQDQVMPPRHRLCIQSLALMLWPMSPLTSLLYTARALIS